jgi:hypothetical protein
MRVVPATVAILAALLLAPTAVGAADATRTPLPVKLGPGSVLWFEGTSTMHNFECKSQEVSLVLEKDAATANPATASELMGLIRSGSVGGVGMRVSVASLHSEKSGLDKNMRKAMDAEKYPDVSFRLETHEVAPAAGDTIAIKAAGALTIHGQERKVQLAARAWSGDGGVWLEGSDALLMSEYGIKPPTMMLGTVKVGDRVTVRYRLLLVPDGGAASPSAAGSK